MSSGKARQHLHHTVDVWLLVPDRVWLVARRSAR